MSVGISPGIPELLVFYYFSTDIWIANNSFENNWEDVQCLSVSILKFLLCFCFHVNFIFFSKVYKPFATWWDSATSFRSKEQYLSYLKNRPGFHFLYKEVAQCFMLPELGFSLMFFTNIIFSCLIIFKTLLKSCLYNTLSPFGFCFLLLMFLFFVLLMLSCL